MNDDYVGVYECGRNTPVFGEFDVVVLGGGPAGISAAVSASRAGCSTLLIERYGFLGGMGTAGGVTNFCGLHANVYGEHQTVVHGVADDLLFRINHLGGLNNPHLILGRVLAQAFDISCYKLAADDLLSSAGVNILFHAFAVGVDMKETDIINALLIETKSGRMAVRGQMFIDCSGDADLAAWCGVPFEKGSGHGDMMYPSTLYRIAGVDPERAGEAWKMIPSLMEEAEKRGIRFPRKGAIVRPQKDTTEWRANITQLRNVDGSAVDGTNVRSLSQAEMDGRRQVRDTFEFLRTVPGFEHSRIAEIATQVGIRETRRIVGEYVLTETDILTCASFDDTVGVNSWPIENHMDGNVQWCWQDIPGSRGFNHLPYRMLLPQHINNLLVAGRCASMSHLGQSAARVTGACFVMGQAAGLAASHALNDGVIPAKNDVKKLQAHLIDSGVYLGIDLK
ncbi:hypothetical protein BTN33_21650 [Aeromonas veronii]|uniref:FAD-dependent oxidoreductase n=1 Tax=Aeromonas veronii TaxID=654 RepID=UPI000946D49D|nr:FAD-dependent oxidoreductase [Aeromonas veronii]OLF56974.1 hypothetical protein BTN33_21650 [Aeromonas veronii]